MTIALKPRPDVAQAIARGPSGPAGSPPVPEWVGTRLDFLMPSGLTVTGPNLLGPQGPAGSAQTFDSVAVVAASIVSGGVPAIRTSGYANPGDGGDAVWTRVGSLPSHTAYIQDSTGAYFEYSDADINVLALGADRLGVAAVQASFNKAISLATYRGKATVRVPCGEYKLTAATTPYAVPILWKGEPGTRVVCTSASDINFFDWQGPGWGLALPLAYDTPENYFAIPIDASSLAVGDFVYFNFFDANGFNKVHIAKVRQKGSAAGEIGMTNKLSVTNGQSKVTVEYANHGLLVDQPIVLRNASTIGGNAVNGLWSISDVVDADHFKFETHANFGSTASNGGGTFTLTFYSLIIDGGIPFALSTAAATKAIKKWTPAIGGGFVDLDLDASTSSGNTTAIYTTHTAFAQFKCRLKGFRAQDPFAVFVGAGLLQGTGYANEYDMYAEDCGSRGFNDLSLYAQTKPIGILRSSRSAGFGPGVYYGSGGDLLIFSEGAGERGVKIDGCCGGATFRIQQNAAGYTGVAISGGNYRIRIPELSSHNSRHANVWFADQDSQHVWIGRCDARGTFWTTDVEIYPSDTNNVIEYLNTDAVVYNGGNAQIHNRWTDYTPALQPFTGGSIGSSAVNAARWMVRGEYCEVFVDITIGTAAPGGGRLQVGLPSHITAVLRSGVFSGLEFNGGAIALTGGINATGSFTIVRADTGGTPLVDGFRLVGSITFKR